MECMLFERFRSQVQHCWQLCKAITLQKEFGARWLLMGASMWSLGPQTPGGLAVRQSL